MAQQELSAPKPLSRKLGDISRPPPGSIDSLSTGLVELVSFEQVHHNQGALSTHTVNLPEEHDMRRGKLVWKSASPSL